MVWGIRFDLGGVNVVQLVVTVKMLLVLVGFGSAEYVFSFRWQISSALCHVVRRYCCGVEALLVFGCSGIVFSTEPKEIA